MKKFTASLILTAAYAQTTSTSTTDSFTSTVNDIKNWFAQKLQDHLGSDNEAVPFGSIAPNDSSNPATNGLDAKIALDTTALGVNFVRYEADYHGLTGFAAGAVHLLYFQIEKPVESADAASRFL
jgi:hypothetical protein